MPDARAGLSRWSPLERRGLDPASEAAQRLHDHSRRIDGGPRRSRRNATGGSSAGDDCGMNLDRLRETDDRHRRGIPTRFACLPDRQRDEGFFSPLIGLGLLRLPTATFDFTERQVVDKRDVAVTLHVTAEMGELMHEAESEAADAVVTKRQANHRRAVAQLQRRAVEVGLGRCRTTTSAMPCFPRNSLASRGPSSDQLSRATTRSRLSRLMS